MVNHEKASKYFPEAYTGNIKKGIEENSIVDIATDLELDTIIRRFGEWVLTTQGIECLTKSHFIPKDKLDEEDWVDIVGSKGWVNESDFALVYYSAKDLMKLGVI